MPKEFAIKTGIHVVGATKEHLPYSKEICHIIDEAAKERKTGIARREPEYIEKKVCEGKAVIALTESGKLAGFCYIESWGKNKDYIANSGLIVVPEFRELGLGKVIKKAAFELSHQMFPDAKLFGITTSPAVMKMNYSLGYRPVGFKQLTDDEDFWAGCKGCVNYDILLRTNHHQCLCTAMLFDPAEKNEKKEKVTKNEEKSSIGV